MIGGHQHGGCIQIVDDKAEQVVQLFQRGGYRALPTDNVLTLLARKDQACWNLWYLSDGSIDTWHKIVVQPSNEKYVEGSRQIGSALAMRYRLMETQFDGVTLRHQVLFESQGGYRSLPFFVAYAKLAGPVLSLINEGLAARKGLLDANAHLIE